MLDDVKERLMLLGYTAGDLDEATLELALLKAQNRLLGLCALSELPDELNIIASDMAAGEFLLIKKAAGGLSNFNLDEAAKQIEAGDTSVTFAYGSGLKTPEQRLDELIKYLMTPPPGTVAAFGSLKW